MDWSRAGIALGSQHSDIRWKRLDKRGSLQTVVKLSKTFRQLSGELRNVSRQTATTAVSEAGGEVTASQALFEAESAAKRGDTDALMRWRQVIEYKYGGLVNATRLARKQKPRG
jgi:hypothetical protein